MSTVLLPEHAAELLVAARDRDKKVHIRFDFDGTIAEFRTNPLESRPHTVAFESYQKLLERPQTSVGVITGRWLGFIDPLFPEPFDLDCSYGLEGRHGGVTWQHPQIEKWQEPLDRFMQRITEAIGAAGDQCSSDARDAAARNAVYIERKPAGVGLHDTPARSRNPDTHVTEAIQEAIFRMMGDFEGLHRHDNNGNVEFTAPLATDDGEEIDKGTVIEALHGFILFSCDDTGDLPAAVRVKERGGIVLAVNHPPDQVRRGSPHELLDMADRVFDSVEDHARFICDLARLYH